MPNVSSLAVWASKQRTGLLSREANQEYVFSYLPEIEKKLEVSLTMPLRNKSWISRDLHPIFQMNLPEGALLEAIRRAIAKIIGEDDLSILQVTGGNQVGRNSFSLPKETSLRSSPSQESLEELLTFPDTEELFSELINRYALNSGVSGAQPKVLLEATNRYTLTSSGYIVKSWGSEYPYLAANEYFCMTAAKMAGLMTPEFFLSDNGGLFIMKRFDLNTDSHPIGFEDICCLQGLGASQKYSSTYERVAKSISAFVSSHELIKAREQFFATLVLSSMVQNGDAHLKNFGVLYDNPQSKVRLAPVYDVVTTTAYIKNDIPALSMAGTKKWWSRKIMTKFAITHLFLSANMISEIFDQIADAVTETKQLIKRYFAQHTEFEVIGNRMMAIWENGLNTLALKK